jgi:tight adherence protein C
MLIRSGYVFGWKPEDLLFYEELGIALGLLFIWQSGQTQPIFWIIAAVGGFMIPELYVKGKGRVRLAEIQRQLPGMVDLVALALESGLDLLAAIERIVGKMKPSALREELQTLIQENRLGTPRKEALQHLAFRTPLPDVQSLTSMIIQSEELGTSLATVLRAYTEDMRSRRILRAEEMAGKMPIKILFPMMVFFFPIVFVIIFGPLALNFMSNYK